MAVVQVKNLEGQGRVCALLRSRQLLHKNVPKQSQVIFSEPYFAQKNVIFRFIKICENFQNDWGTEIFWFLKTSMEVDIKIPKSTN